MKRESLFLLVFYLHFKCSPHSSTEASVENTVKEREEEQERKVERTRKDGQRREGSAKERERRGGRRGKRETGRREERRDAEAGGWVSVHPLRTPLQ